LVARAGAAGCVCLAVAVLGSASASASGKAGAPATIAKAGVLTVCSDEIEPPFIYAKTSGQLTGSEYDIVAHAAKAWGVKLRFVRTGFDGLFANLKVGRCNVAIDEITDTAAREKSVAFVDYMSVGQTFLVAKGNPDHITTFGDLCGRAAGGVLGSTDLAYLYTVQAKCVADNKPAMTVEAFNDDPTGVTAIITGKIQAFEEDTPLLSGLVAAHPKEVQLSSQTEVDRLPCGIAVVKGAKAVQNDLAKELNRLYASSSMQAIFKKFKESGVALSGKNPVKVDAVGKSA
jgi:polar amino acid transport system substrate-binding protein